jgi:hypothetical protein
MMLRLSAIVLALIGSAALFATGEKSVAETPADKPFSITISTETQSVKAASEVDIKIRLTNTSGHDLIITAMYLDGIDASYIQEVYDKKGNLMKPSERQGAIKVRSARRILRPGETARGETGLNPRYNPSPGEYVVRLSRAISDNPDDGVVKSNEIDITLTP